MTKSPKGPNSKYFRFLNRDGSLNISRNGLKRRLGLDLYHSLLSASWAEFFVFVIATYMMVNFVFAMAYFRCGSLSFSGMRHENVAERFQDCFFFSVQTLATIGYGHISPISLVANILVTIEAFMGLLGLAIITGLLFSRFSKPTARVTFSHNAIIGPYDGKNCFVFRVANERLNQISEAHVGVVAVKNEVTQEGDRLRRIYDLRLERSHSPVFALSWTAVHPIDEASPLFGMNEKDLAGSEVEILAYLSGIDETFSQPILARCSYTAEDIVWNRRFKNILSRGDDQKIHIDIGGIHELE